MGGALSKSSKPKFQSVRSTKPKPLSGNIAEASLPPSLTKSPEIQEDGMDRQLDQMLRKLGPVNVPKMSTTFQPRNSMIKILENREEDAPSSQSSIPASGASTPSSNQQSMSSLPPNRLNLSTICELLDRNKTKPISSLSKKELEEILGDQKIDSETLSSLVKSYTTISIKLVKNPDPTVDEPVKMAVWVPQPK